MFTNLTILGLAIGSITLACFGNPVGSSILGGLAAMSFFFMPGQDDEDELTNDEIQRGVRRCGPTMHGRTGR